MSLDPYGRCYSVSYARHGTTRMRSDAFKLGAVFFFKSSLLSVGRDFIEAKTTFRSQFKVSSKNSWLSFAFLQKSIFTQISLLSVVRHIVRAKTAFRSQT